MYSNKMQKDNFDNNEKYIEFAFGNYDSKKFLEYFQLYYGDIYSNYIDLNIKNGTVEDFKANPLVFILMNEPRCCLNIAKLFIDNELKGRHRSETL